ncbi:MAG TPA: carboxypeptidase regulatory-like domain-containing protein [Candidatus Acidoferrales bacterium]|nr:carboxypeptidase regulatory-like domain-containing protein [Candidatus Acidoferrales bacterium]
MKSLRINLSIILLLVLAVSPALFAQVDYSTATLRGTVLDPQDKAIAGATVTVTNSGTGVSKSAKTGTDGAYQFSALPPGTYKVQVEAQGFEKTIHSNLSLSVGQVSINDVHLKVGTLSDVVEVEATPALIATEQTQQANTINENQVGTLPNLGRDITNAVYTLPGVSNADAPRSQQPGFTGFFTTGFSIGGSNGRNNLSTIDGGENEYGTGQYRVTTIPLDAVQEFQVNRNAFTAEFGFTDGSAINIVTKSGGNKYHGNAYGYFRDHSTEATNFFNGLEGLPKAFDQSVYTGGTIGGPLKKDKLFYFLAYEYRRLDSPDYTNAGVSPSTTQLPTLLGLNNPNLGNSNPAFGTCANQFATGIVDQVCYLNGLKSSGDPFLVGFANGITPGLSPLNSPALKTILTRDGGIFNNPTRDHNTILKFDAQPNPNNSVSLRLGYSHNDNHGGNPDASGLFTRDFSILGNWTRTIGPTLVNQVLLQAVPRNRANNLPNPFTGVNFSLGNLNVGGLGGTSTFGSPSLVPYIAHQTRYQFEDDITWTKGVHTFKFGASYRPANYHVEDDLWFNNQFDFRDGAIPLIGLAGPACAPTAGDPIGPCPTNHLAFYNATHGFPQTGPTSTNLSAPQSFVFGIPVDVLAGNFPTTVGPSNPKWQGWGHYFGSYIQDAWKLNRKLTMNYGVRLDTDKEPAPLGTNFYASPRLGLAWDPAGDHKTVIRAGAGIYTAPIDVLIPSYGSLLDGSGRYINEVLFALPSKPGIIALWQNGVVCAQQPTCTMGKLPFGRLTPADFAAVGLITTSLGATVGYSVAPNYKNPYTVQGSLSIDRELVKNLSFEVGYNMYHGVHLQMPLETAYAQIPVGSPLCPTPACTDITGGPLYHSTTGQLQHTTYESIGSSIYHGLTTSLTKRYSRGMQFQVNYTWSKTIDNVIDFASFQNWFRPSRLDLFRAVSVFDIPHNFVVNAVYTTPFKSNQGNILARALADISLAPIVYYRSGLPFSIRTPSLANGVALDNNFAMPFGASRDSNRGANYAAADLRIQKGFFLNRDRGVKVELIAEGTNISNHVNFNKVADLFDVGGFSNAVKLANGQTLNLFTGPYKGLQGVRPTSRAAVQTPLSFQSADLPRRVQFGLRLAF